MDEKNSNKILYKNAFILLGVVSLIIILWKLQFFTPGYPPPNTNPTPEMSTSPTINDPPFVFDEKGIDKVQNLLANRLPLSKEDQLIKTQLTTQSNPLKMTDNYRLDYFPQNDEFQAEITTTKIDTAKEEVTQWLKSQGLSDDGICKLPLVFTIKSDQVESLRGLNITFNPLPLNCN